MGVTFLFWGVREVWKDHKEMNRAKGYLAYMYEIATLQLSSVSLHLLVGLILMAAGGIALFF